MRTPRVSDQYITEKFLAGLTDAQIAAMAKMSPEYVRVRRMRLRLLRKKRGVRDQSKSRHQSHLAKRSVILGLDHDAIREVRTLFPSTRTAPQDAYNILVPGINSRKIGSTITKGSRKGSPIFTLTLEERATCPVSCRHWRSCFGNNMHLARRITHDDNIGGAIESDLTYLQNKHPAGFAVRLHVLGDFYSVAYVEMWETFLDKFPALFVFGFSARHDAKDPIARALINLTIRRWERFSMRFSNAPADECSTISIEHHLQCPPDAIICPAQTGKTKNCGTCALCWNSRRRIAFIQH